MVDLPDDHVDDGDDVDALPGPLPDRKGLRNVKINKVPLIVETSSPMAEEEFWLYSILSWILATLLGIAPVFAYLQYFFATPPFSLHHVSSLHHFFPQPSSTFCSRHEKGKQIWPSNKLGLQTFNNVSCCWLVFSPRINWADELLAVLHPFQFL